MMVAVRMCVAIIAILISSFTLSKMRLSFTNYTWQLWPVHRSEKVGKGGRWRGERGV